MLDRHQRRRGPAVYLAVGPRETRCPSLRAVEAAVWRGRVEYMRLSVFGGLQPVPVSICTLLCDGDLLGETLLSRVANAVVYIATTGSAAQLRRRLLHVQVRVVV